jgi:hypothetical protein
MKQLWKACLGIFTFATLTANAWGQSYEGTRRKGTTESILAWTTEQVEQIKEALSSWEMDLQNRWADFRQGRSRPQSSSMGSSSRSSSGQGRGQRVVGVSGRGQDADRNFLDPGTGSPGRGAVVCPQGTGRSGRGKGTGRARASGRVVRVRGQLQSPSGGASGMRGLTSMDSRLGNGSRGKGSGLSASGRGKGRRKR